MACFLPTLCYSGLEYSMLSVLRTRHAAHVAFELLEAGEQLSTPQNHGSIGPLVAGKME